MKQFGELIGGLVGLLLIGAILYGIVSSGPAIAMAVLAILGIIIYYAVHRKNCGEKEQEGNVKVAARGGENEILKKNRLENLSEDEFVSFVKTNLSRLDQFFTVECVGRGHGVKRKKWSTGAYTIIFEVDNNGFSELVKIVRKKDNTEIFASGWA